jgi:hypothetical protein
MKISAKGCEHCRRIITDSPLPCRYCGGVTECMFDVGPLTGFDGAKVIESSNNHDHYELCSGELAEAIYEARKIWIAKAVTL